MMRICGSDDDAGSITMGFSRWGSLGDPQLVLSALSSKQFNDLFTEICTIMRGSLCILAVLVLVASSIATVVKDPAYVPCVTC